MSAWAANAWAVNAWAESTEWQPQRKACFCKRVNVLRVRRAQRGVKVQGALRAGGGGPQLELVIVLPKALALQRQGRLSGFALGPRPVSNSQRAVLDLKHSFDAAGHGRELPHTHAPARMQR